MELVDVHCHLESGYLFNNLGQVLEDARNAGIKKLITSSIVPDQWETSLNLGRSYEEIECALGIHPWYIEDHFLQDIDNLGDTILEGAIALGEIGLDTKINNPPMEKQVLFFERQLSIARYLNLPVIIHCRGAFGEVKKSIKRVGMPDAGGIIHNFNGSVEIAEDLIPLGFSFSIGGVLTYRNSRKRIKLLNKIYPGHFLLETDSPDIPPVEVRSDTSAPNVPANIIYNLRAASEILEVPAEDIARHTTENAKNIFNLKFN